MGWAVMGVVAQGFQAGDAGAGIAARTSDKYKGRVSPGSRFL